MDHPTYYQQPLQPQRIASQHLKQLQQSISGMQSCLKKFDNTKLQPLNEAAIAYQNGLQ